MSQQFWSYIFAFFVFIEPLSAQSIKLLSPVSYPKLNLNVNLNHYNELNLHTAYLNSDLFSPEMSDLGFHAAHIHLPLFFNHTLLPFLNPERNSLSYHYAIRPLPRTSLTSSSDLDEVRNKLGMQIECNKLINRKLLNVKSELTHLKDSIAVARREENLLNGFVEDKFNALLWTTVLLLAFILLGIFVLDQYLKKKRYELKKLSFDKDKASKNAFKLLKVNQKLVRQKQDVLHQNNKLKTLHHVKDKLFAIIAHDLRRPLNNIEEILAMIKDRSLTLEEIQGIAEPLYEHVSYTSVLLDNLLNWAQQQIHGLNVSPQRIQLYQLIEDNLKLLSFSAQRKGISLENHAKRDTVIWVDPNMIDLVIRNLLSNAIKFSANGDFVHVCTKRRNKYVEIVVKDSGVGISEHHQQNIFQSFPAVSTPGTMDEHGSGLGLILCKDFVEKNGGTIWFESELGEGSIFTFTVPLYKMQATATPA